MHGGFFHTGNQKLKSSLYAYKNCIIWPYETYQFKQSIVPWEKYPVWVTFHTSLFEQILTLQSTGILEVCALLCERFRLSFKTTKEEQNSTRGSVV